MRDRAGQAAGITKKGLGTVIQENEAASRAAAEPEAKLSLPLDRLRERYEVVVVGSGYGGSIAASRLARLGRSVCVLERGRELRPGDYPDTPWRAARQLPQRPVLH